MVVKTLENFRHLNVRMDIEFIPVSQDENHSIITVVFKYYTVETSITLTTNITNSVYFLFKIGDQKFTKNKNTYTVKNDGTKTEVWRIENIKLEHEQDGTRKSKVSFVSLRGDTSTFNNSELSSISNWNSVVSCKRIPQFSTVSVVTNTFLDQFFIVNIKSPSSHFRHTISVYMGSENKDNEISQDINQPSGKTVHKFTDKELQLIYSKLGTAESTKFIIKCDSYKNNVLTGTTRVTTNDMFINVAKIYDVKSNDNVVYNDIISLSVATQTDTVYKWNKSKFTFKVISPDKNKHYTAYLYLYSEKGVNLTTLYKIENIKELNKTFTSTMETLANSYIFENITTSKKFILRIYTETYNSSNTLIGTDNKYVKFEFDTSVYDLIPPVPTVTYIDSNSKTSTLIGNNQILVQNHSSLQIQFSNATVKQQASYGDITITLGTKSKRYSRNSPSGTITITSTDTSELLNQNGNLLLIVLFEDSRGYSSQKQFTVKVLEYSNPVFQLETPNRNTTISTTANFKIKGYISPLIVDNTSKNNIKLAVLEIDDGRDYTITSNFIPDISKKGYFTADFNLTGFVTNRVYKFQLILTDNLDVTVLESDAKISDLQTATPLFKITPSGVDIQISIDKIYPVGAIYISTVSTSPDILFGGTWVRFGQGRGIIGLDESNTNFNTPSKTGGSSTHRHEWRIGMHWYYGSAVGEAEESGTGAYYDGENRYDGWHDSFPNITGTVNRGSEASSFESNAGGRYSQGRTMINDNISPYIVCYMWRRTS